MSDVLRIMDKLEEESAKAMHGPFIGVEPDDWQSLRTALEAQRRSFSAETSALREELAQKDARIAELENAMLDMRKISQGGSISAADGMEIVIDEVMAASEREAKEASDE